MTNSLLKREAFEQSWKSLQEKAEISDTYDTKRDPYLGTDSLSMVELWNIIQDAQKDIDKGDLSAKEFISQISKKFSI